MPVTKDDVIWCYKNILGREPEKGMPSEQQLAIPDFRKLVLSFINSAELYNRLIRARPRAQLVPAVLPPADIEIRATPAQLGLLLDRIRQSWTQLGMERPHHSVLTDKRFLPEKLEETEGEFWASGEKEAKNIDAMLASHGFEGAAGKIAVEYGCGLGRITRPLARRFRHVHAYDISPTHLSKAREGAAGLGIDNVSFHLRGDNFFADLHACDAFYSRIVFQHNPPPVIQRLIRLALQSLTPGGIGIFQVQIYRKGYSFAIDAYLAQPQKTAIEMHVFPQSEVFALIAEADCKLLSVREDAVFQGVLSNMFIVRRRRD